MEHELEINFVYQNSHENDKNTKPKDINFYVQ